MTLALESNSREDLGKKKVLRNSCLLTQIAETFSLKRHYIEFFENAFVCSCMWSTSVNMFSANWREDSSNFDKNEER